MPVGEKVLYLLLSRHVFVQQAAMIEKKDCDEDFELSMRHSEYLTSKAYPPMLSEILFSKHAS